MIYAVDPGGTTGVAVWDQTWNAPRLEQFDNWLECVYSLHLQIRTGDWLIVERFDLRPGVKSQQLDPLYAIGALQYVTRLIGNGLVLLTPAQAKSFAKDDKLRTLWGDGFGKALPHAKDAARHLLTFLCTYGEGRVLGGDALLKQLVQPYAPEGWQGGSAEPAAH